VLPIAVQWGVRQYVDLMGARSPEGLLVVLRLVEPMVVPPIAAHMAVQRFAERTEGQPSLLVVFTVHITALVPLQRVSRLARLPVPRRLRLIAIHPLTATRHHTIHHRPTRERGTHAGLQTHSNCEGQVRLSPGNAIRPQHSIRQPIRPA
jgi:hypothetical protein